VHLREPARRRRKPSPRNGGGGAGRVHFHCVHAEHGAGDDNAGTVALIHERAKAEGAVNVFVTGAITKGIAGEELAPIGGLKRPASLPSRTTAIVCRTTTSCAGACEYAKMFGLPVMDHCQDYSLVTDGVMHEGYWSTVLGLRGWPSAVKK